MSKRWCLVLSPPVAPVRRPLGGLSLPLRLALDAQAAGAFAVAVEAKEATLLQPLADARLHIPIIEKAPHDCLALHVPANTLLHRATFPFVLGQLSQPVGRVDVPELAMTHSVPWGFTPQTIVDEKSAKVAERLLFRSLRKPVDGWTSRYLNRYISLFLSRLLVRTPLSPNQISVFILLIGLLGAISASRGSYGWMLLGATLFQIQSILDGCDGEISRISFRGSHLGEWLDTIGDDLTNYSFFAGAAVGLYRTTHQWHYLGLGAIVVVCGVLASGIEYAYLLRIGSGDLVKYPLSQATSSPTGPGRFIAPLFKRDTFVFLSWVAALLDQVGPMLLVFALGGLSILVAVLSTELRLARERKGRVGNG